MSLSERMPGCDADPRICSMQPRPSRMEVASFPGAIRPANDSPADAGQPGADDQHIDMLDRRDRFHRSIRARS